VTRSARTSAGSILVVLGSVLVVLSAVVLVGCSGSTSDGAGGDTSASTSVPSGPVLRVCTDAPYEVFEFGSPPDLEGFDVDLARLVGERLDRPVEMVVTPLDQFPTALAAGTCDLVASALPLPPEGARELGYSTPYLEIEQVLTVRAADAATITGLAATSGRTVGVVDGSAGADLATDLLPADATVVTFPTWTELERALRDGTVDAALGDGPLADRAALLGGGLTVVARQPGDTAYALAVAPTSTDLLVAVDTALADLAADGSLAQLEATWFGR
jgi:cystine transport system substrate-binding protein